MRTRIRSFRIGAAVILLLGGIVALYNTSVVDRFGQLSRAEWPGKVHSAADMKAQAARESSLLLSQAPSANRDSLGGWSSGPQLTATGWFRTTQWGGRWWLVTPTGHLFFSIGVNSVRPGDWTQTSGWTPRFSWLPPSNSPLAAAGRSNNGHQEFNFYRANLIRKYGREWQAKWRDATLRRLRAWGFNTVGAWSDPSVYMGPHTLPYTVVVDDYDCPDTVSFGRIYRRTIMDVFSPAWKPAMEKAVLEAAKTHSRDPKCIGYFVDNELAWGYEGFSSPETLPRAVLKQPARSPAKTAFVGWLRQKYGVIDHLNAAWGTAFPTWDALSHNTQDLPQSRPALAHDLDGLIRFFAQTYYAAVSSALHRAAPHQLYLGSRFAACPHPVVEECARYAAVVSFNVYKRSLSPAAWSFTTDIHKPCMVSEFHFGSLDRGLLNAGRVPTRSQTDRAAAYREYINSLVTLPAFVGAHWFEYVDEPLTGRSLDGENYNIGLVSVADVPYPELTSVMRSTNSNLYQLLSQNNH